MSDIENVISLNAFSEEGWNDLLKKLDKFLPDEKTMKRAIYATCFRMTKWMRVKASRELTVILQMPRMAIYHRFLEFRIRGEMSGGKLWLGLKGVPFIQLRPFKVDNKGVMTGYGHYYDEHAFINTIRKSGHEAVFRRIGKERNKLEIVRADIYDPCLLWLNQQVSHPEFARKFFERLEHELKWRTTIKQT
ncbi:hypothetical protein PT277_01530 [Acetobacteraceae bacterium ESL0709]|nr:hypothetical protein [Acetobacteraceae bacterium ESL0697]MDF7677382.1 hypothetical protein [Acetobacteraceae bacterium ESL0709]